MANRSRAFIIPGYIFAGLILGGSAQGLWQNMVLQLAGIVIIACSALDKANEPLAPSARQLLYIGALGISVAALQLVPLPSSVWTDLGPRNAVARGFQTLGMRLPGEPLSLSPAAGLDSLLKIIPPLALVCAMVRLREYRPQWLAGALIAGAIAGIALGALQVASFRPNSAEQSSWYLYADTNPGRGVGFFANANHMATLLVITIPFLAALIAVGRRSSAQGYSAIIAAAVGLAIVVFVGIALNGSLAGYGLAVPVVAASSLIILPSSNRFRTWVAALAALLVIASISAIEETSIGGGQLGTTATTSVQSRAEILSTTSRAIGEFMPFGTGLGSFERVYPLYERPEHVTSTFVVHAHNDYFELVLELGIAGIVLLVLFLAWWAVAVWRVWRTPERGPFARAAAIASAAILVHSLVDFPLRTAAISTCFAMCLGLLAGSRASVRSDSTELRRTRHVVI